MVRNRCPPRTARCDPRHPRLTHLKALEQRYAGVVEDRAIRDAARRYEEKTRGTTRMLLRRVNVRLGLTAALLTLVTGSLWGKPTWGTWWVWDARLTSVLILFFLYLGYIALQNAFDDRGRSAKAAAILALVGFVNVPIIKGSVEWWHTLHQPASVLRMDGPTIHISMLTPLLLMAVSFAAILVVLLLLRVKSALMAQKIRVLRLAQAGTDPHIGER